MALRGTIIVPCDEVSIPLFMQESEIARHIDFLIRYAHMYDLNIPAFYQYNNPSLIPHGEVEYQMVSQEYAIIEYFDYNEGPGIGAIAYLPYYLGKEQKEKIKNALSRKMNWELFEVLKLESNLPEAKWVSDSGNTQLTYEQFVKYIDSIPLTQSSSQLLR